MDNDEIEKATTGDEYTQQSHSVPIQYPAHHRRSPLLAILVTLGVSVVGIAGFWWLIWTSSVFDKPADALTFITGGALTLALLIFAIVQVCVYWSQRNKMQDSLALTDRIIYKMQGQLDAMKSQGLLMDQSLLESQKLALQTEKMATFAQHQLEVMKLQGDTLTTQCEIMTHSLLATKQLVEQNERAVKAAEETAKALGWADLTAKFVTSQEN